MTAHSIGRRAVLLVILVLSGLAAGCSDATGPTDPASPEPTPIDFASPAAPRSPVPTEGIEGILSGDWRRLPVGVRDGEGMAKAELACRVAEPDIGSLPVAVIDARGQGRLILVFAANATGVAWECRAPLGAQTAAEVTVLALQASGEPIADEGIDTRHYEAVELGEERGIVMVGRYGRLVDEAIGQFSSDESYVYAALGGGWWTMWWPGSEPVNGVGATDTHNVVIGETRPLFPLIP